MISRSSVLSRGRAAGGPSYMRVVLFRERPDSWSSEIEFI